MLNIMIIERSLKLQIKIDVMKQLILIAMCSISLCYGQSSEYRGTVIMSNLTPTIEGIEVKIVGDGYELRTTTNQAGAFFISNPSYPFRACFEHVSIDKFSSTVKTPADNIFLVDLKYKLEVTVTGNSYIRAVGITKKLEIQKNDPPSKIQFNLSKVPGIQVRGRGVILIRGEVPIYIVNGFRFDVASLDDLHIDKSDIKTIEVLKGAEAFIYGNNTGAVLRITTR